MTGSVDEKEWKWKVILEEWSWLMKNEDVDHLFDLAKNIYILRTHIIAVDYCVFYLKIQYDQDVADKLSEVYPMDYRVKDNVAKALVMVDTKRYELEILSDEYSRLQDNNKGKKTTESDFDANIARLGKYQGYRMDKFHTTVSEFASIYQNYIAEAKAKESTK